MMRFVPVLLVLVAAGCSEEEVRTLSAPGLLARAPDRVIDQPGELRPGTAEWAECAFDGWKVAGEPAVAWSLVREARVRLPLVAPADSTLELELRAPPGLAAVQARVALSLNEQPLGEIELGPDAATHSLPAPAALWKRGDNVLRFTGTASGKSAEGRAAFLGLARLGYARAQVRVSRSERGIELPPGCAVAYRLETLADTRLWIEGRATGEGRLEVRARELDPLTGAALGEVVEPRSLEPEDGALAGACVLPCTAGTLELELAWLGERGSRCELRALERSELAPVERRSVLFVSIDTLSAQHMSLHGYARPTTPRLAAFARDAVLFRNCRANAPWTIPSYMSQFTGLLPGAHMLERPAEPEREPETWELHQLAPNRWTLAEFLRAAGYRTAAFVDNPWLARGFGFTQGFDEYDAAAAEIGLEDPEGGLRFTVPRVLEWLDRRPRGEPFFLFVQAFDPHAPYLPVPPWKGRFGADGLVDPDWKVPVGREQAFAYGCIPQHVFSALHPGGTLPAELAVAPIAAAYDEKVLEVDAAMGRLLEGLEERGLYDELVILFSADHGESTTGHDLFFNHSLLHGDVLHVPLILRLPGGERAGTVIEPPVQLVDLYPTLVELVRGESERGLHGASLLPLVRGTARARGLAYAEWGMMEQASAEEGGWKLIATQPLFSRPQTQLTSPRLGRARLGQLCPELAAGWFTDSEITAALARNPAARSFLEQSLAGPFFELYRLADDPLETRDLSAEHPEQVARLLELLRTGREKSKQARATARFLSPAVELEPADLAELEALGYGGGD